MLQQGLTEPLETVSVFGVPMHVTTHYFDWLRHRLQQRQGCHVVTLNAEMVMQAERDHRLAAVIQQAEFVIPDGAGVVLYLRLHGKRTQRCPGIELAEGLLQELGQAPHQGSAYFLGGAPGVAQRAAEIWQQRVPGLAIAGTQHGYLTPDDEAALTQTLAQQQPDVILVGLGVPRQEFWIAAHRHLCPQAIWIGVGGSFDIWSGSKVRAPAWFRNNHLEWLYRLYQEPWRWKRMLALPKFAGRALLYRLTQGRSAKHLKK